MKERKKRCTEIFNILIVVLMFYKWTFKLKNKLLSIAGNYFNLNIISKKTLNNIMNNDKKKETLRKREFIQRKNNSKTFYHTIQRNAIFLLFILFSCSFIPRFNTNQVSNAAKAVQDLAF